VGNRPFTYERGDNVKIILNQNDFIINGESIGNNVLQNLKIRKLNGVPKFIDMTLYIGVDDEIEIQCGLIDETKAEDLYNGCEKFSIDRRGDV